MQYRITVADLASSLLIFVACGEPTGQTSARVVVHPSTVEMFTSDTASVTLRAFVVRASDDSTMANVSWTSANPAIATVDESGVVHAASSAGMTDITATVDGLTAKAEIAVNVRYPSATMTPTSSVISQGDTVRLSVSVYDARDQTFIPSPEIATKWSSTNPTIVTVDETGLVTGRRAGLATISANIMSLTTQTTVRVDGEQFVFPDTNVLLPGMDRQLKLEYFRTTTGLEQLTGATWVSSNPGVVDVDPSGRITAHADGEATITATRNGLSSTARIYVRSFPAPLIFAQVAAHAGGACGITTDRDTFCWGSKPMGNQSPTDRCESVSRNTLPGTGWFRGTRPCTAIPMLVLVQPKPARLIPGAPWALASDNTLVPLLAGLEQVWANGFEFADVSIDWHRCGLDSDSRGYCWNANTFGQLGQGTIQALGPWATTPGEVVGDRRWSTIQVNNRYSTCGLTTAGEAFCWGFNQGSQLGIGRAPCAGNVCWSVPVPQRVLTDARFTSLVTTGRNSCALTADGKPWCWGFASTRLPEDQQGLPVEVGAPTLTNLYGRHESSTPDIWGKDASGNTFILERNEGATAAFSLFSFVRSQLPFPVTTLVSFMGRACAISTVDAKLYCWGAGASGMLGHGGFADAPMTAPVLVAGQVP